MSIIKISLFFSFLYLVLAQKAFPMMPNPGYDTITSHPIFDVGNENTTQTQTTPLNKENSTPIIMTNGTIIVNTTNINPKCNLECYTGCRVLFPEFIEQKYCIINVCKCQIIEKEVKIDGNINNNITESSSNQIMNSEIHKYSTTGFMKNTYLSELFKNEKNNFYWIFYLLIFVISFGYEFFICHYISEKNEFSLINWFTEKNDNKYKKYRITNDNESDDKYNNDDELRRCLI